MSTLVSKFAVKDMQVPANGQRLVRKQSVDALVRKWDINLSGVIVLSKRPDGTYAVIDGQHRVAAATELGVRVLRAEVHEGLSLVEEAQMFRALNQDRLRTNQYDLYVASVAAQDPLYAELQKVLDARGLALAANSGPNSLKCVGEIVKQAKAHGPEIVGEVLDLASEAWGRHAETWQAPLIGGLATLLGTHEQLDRKRLLSVLRGGDSAVWMSRVALRLASGGLGGGGSWTRGRASYETFRAAYDHGLRRGRLAA